jgi:hypothetical protein
MREPGYLLASVAPSSNPADAAIKVLVVVGAGLPVCELFFGSMAVTFNVYVLNGTAANVIVIKRGSYFTLY